MKIVFLTNDFYNDYNNCNEIEKKDNRPYIVAIAKVNDIDFAIPLRSNINHKHVVWTDKVNKCGLDLSKSVVINDMNKYIDSVNKPHIRQNEFDSLRGKDYIISKKLENYIKKYKKAFVSKEPRRKQDQLLLNYSTLQYFHSELGIE